MGYSTEFYGQFELDRPLTAEHSHYLTQFSETRRMKRDENKARQLEDDVRHVVGLPVGRFGEYFVGGLGFRGQYHDSSIIDYNDPPPSQPGLWCQWTPSLDGKYIEWDGGEKFYDYVDWLNYIIHHFLIPWGYTLSGSVAWEGEDEDDTGVITVVNNRVTTRRS